VTFIREDKKLDLFEFEALLPKCGQVEAWAYEQRYDVLIGLDEAGRGPLAGPVVAAAVAWNRPCKVKGIDDSKRLTAKRREELFELIQSESRSWGIAVVGHEEIDRINILQASLQAMGKAWLQAVDRELSQTLKKALVLVDGNQRATLPTSVEQRPVVKGDARSLHIAAASILAKVARDRLMLDYHQQWPEYGFDRHKGYPTSQHLQAIRQYGPCPIHRRSFKLPVRGQDASA
jgi:ribonuclease HII